MQPTLAHFIERAAARKSAAAQRQAAQATGADDRRVVAMDVSVGVLALNMSMAGGGYGPLLRGTHVVLKTQSIAARQ